jgi:uncharacterized cupin superfamily protein
VILSEVAPAGGGGEQPYTLAADREFVFVLSGSLRVVVGEEEHLLGAGDALTFSPREPHTWANGSVSEAAVALWVLTPSPYAPALRG